ncbi:MAG: adenine phosphoribosyltransferase [Euryarchaeota archaeon]|jgi:adenine phosphoribosyltransferase|nr:adenine phosphoribosyltransferase [Euryarchaeota archaeon]MBT3653584.1 adenine phosphoribosyltransferase [Euryarchaeota archaeon]MBT3757147.1 adenine phosphoribosyltransferase [Euryarchaeota archaeon]MBT4051076.1 adenine phosphoribosyltransferase [Euryarchaeota archaeon]MBT4347112.1 adenine phosphoribosyltransferase [Euryarchaeota archaeon]
MLDEFTERLRNTVRTIPDFPIEGIQFRDITPVLSDGKLLSEITDRFVKEMNDRNWQPDAVVGPESRGFIFGALLAAKLGIAFIPVRKPGKLPHAIIREEYSLEYGTNVIEIHKDAIMPDQKLVIIDDLLATGGTVRACHKLCNRLDANILGNLFVIELDGLGGSESLYPIESVSLVKFPA